MAELPHLGKHCSHVECKRLDFLSIGCTGCAQAFCKDHFAFDNHNCSRQFLKEAPKKELCSDNSERSFRCSLPDCSNSELTPVTCPFCEANFCLQHRHQPDHNCKNLETKPDRMQQTKQHVQDILNKPNNDHKASTKGRKSKAMAAKVALMKIKQKAVGDKGLPDSERVYMNIIVPAKYKSLIKPVFVSKQWSVGKSIDDIASRLKLENRNNDTTAEKLKLLDPETKDAFLFERVVSELLSEESLFNGGTLLLEYMAPLSCHRIGANQI